MEVREMIELMKAVSDYGLTKFEVEQGDTRLVIKKHSLHSADSMLYTASHTEGAEAKNPTTMEIKEGEGNQIYSPLVGTFYSASSPEAEPFVKVGDYIKKGQILGIVEAMKLMNEIESEYDGILEAVLVRNEETVEYGQPLFVIRRNE